METTARGSRDIARAAVRAEISRIAVEAFLEQGFDELTLTELAARAGVSRSTLLRHFPTKEDAVLADAEDRGHVMEEALRGRPRDESDWAALGHAVDALLIVELTDERRAFQLSRLTSTTRSLVSKRREQHAVWGSRLALVLLERHDGRTALEAAALAQAAMACLGVALDAWNDGDGQEDLRSLARQALRAVGGTNGTTLRV